MPAVVMGLLTQLFGASFAASLGFSPELPMLAIVGAVGVAAIAIVVCLRYVLQSAGGNRSGVSRSPFERIDLRTLVAQSDPNAAGHPRTRAPSLRPSAA
jgi:hypothetical protein